MAELWTLRDLQKKLAELAGCQISNAYSVKYLKKKLKVTFGEHNHIVH